MRVAIFVNEYLKNHDEDMDKIMKALDTIGGIKFLLEKKCDWDSALLGGIIESKADVLGGKLTIRWEYDSSDGG